MTLEEIRDEMSKNEVRYEWANAVLANFEEDKQVFLAFKQGDGTFRYCGCPKDLVKEIRKMAYEERRKAEVRRITLRDVDKIRRGADRVRRRRLKK